MTRPSPSRGRSLIRIAQPFIGAEEKAATLEVLESGYLVQGVRVQAFETAFADYIGTAHAVATNSGTAALHTALRGLRVGPRDEVIMPAITFFACAAMVAARGATPVAVDVTDRDYNLDPDRAAEAVTPRTKAVMPVHLYGQAAEMGPLQDLAEDREIALLEDACQSHGATYDGLRVGGLGDVGCFSFYPSKLITTGEGGMLVTDDEALAETGRKFRNHGGVRKYAHDFLGYNYRMTDLGAALGITQLNRIQGFIQARKKNAAFLTRGLKDTPGLQVPEVMPGRTHVFYQYVLRVEDPYPLSRDALIEALKKRGVESRPSYPRPIHEQPAFPSFGRATPTPVAARVLPNLLEIPVHPRLTAADLESIRAAFDDLG